MISVFVDNLLFVLSSFEFQMVVQNVDDLLPTKGHDEDRVVLAIVVIAGAKDFPFNSSY